MSATSREIVDIVPKGLLFGNQIIEGSSSVDIQVKLL